ncbi:hypothetical protein [Brevundimonas sp. Leaf363]|uniref:hypothetical protein n=1 Tax=Brevundimonas sp. Leaf363 TaxID=1736353 RepID=UPI000B18D1F9|nr:hypothetical protein [Brevundimonas sp. Leaf363]
MTMKLFRIVVHGPGGDRTIRVPSPTEVQAGDAAAPLMAEGDAIVSVEEELDASQVADAAPPKTQAEELTPVTPGAAAAD